MKEFNFEDFAAKAEAISTSEVLNQIKGGQAQDFCHDYEGKDPTETRDHM